MITFLSFLQFDKYLRWQAPETIREKQHTKESDYWSYGLVLFEIYSKGLYAVFTSTLTLVVFLCGLNKVIENKLTVKQSK